EPADFQYLPSRTSKWVGLPRLRPPCCTQCAIQRSMVSNCMDDGPNRAQSCDEFPSNAVGDSTPLNRGGFPNKSPKREAISRTEKRSGRQRFHTEGGDAARARDRSVVSLASPCQMQLK